MSFLNRLLNRPTSDDVSNATIDRAAEIRELAELDQEAAKVQTLMEREAAQQKIVDQTKRTYDAAANALAETRLELMGVRECISRRESIARNRLAMSANSAFNQAITELEKARERLSAEFVFGEVESGDIYRGLTKHQVCRNGAEIRAKSEAITLTIRKLIDAKGKPHDADAAIGAITLELEHAIADIEAAAA